MKPKWEQIGQPIDDPKGDPNIWLVPFYVTHYGGDCHLYRCRFPRGTLYIPNLGPSIQQYKYGESIRVHPITKLPIGDKWIDGTLKKKQTLIQIDDDESGNWFDNFVVMMEGGE